MIKERWFDHKGVEIYEGDTVRDISTGDEELVYACSSSAHPGKETLGVNASNEAFLKNHPERAREVYPFTNFTNVPHEDGRKLVFYEKVVK